MSITYTHIVTAKEKEIAAGATALVVGGIYAATRN